MTEAFHLVPIIADYNNQLKMRQTIIISLLKISVLPFFLKYMSKKVYGQFELSSTRKTSNPISPTVGNPSGSPLANSWINRNDSLHWELFEGDKTILTTRGLLTLLLFCPRGFLWAVVRAGESVKHNTVGLQLSSDLSWHSHLISFLRRFGQCQKAVQDI